MPQRVDLVKQLASSVVKRHWWTAHSKVVVAVSTGIDSMSLLDLMSRLRDQRPHLIVAHVNHELRQASWTEEKFLRRTCAQTHLPLVVTHWPKSEHPQTGTENAARKFRYQFFLKVMQKYDADVLVTAHHLNDQAETVLMRMIRGGDLHELTGIHQVRPFGPGQLIRPLLNVAKSRIRAYAKWRGFKYYSDATNLSLKITRNRMRHQYLPALARENPQVVEHLGSYAHQLKWLLDNNQQLNQHLAQELQLSDHNWQSVPRLLKFSPNLQRGILEALWHPQAKQILVLPQHLTEIIHLLNDSTKPQGVIALGHGWEFIKRYQRFTLCQHSSSADVIAARQITLNRWYWVNAQTRCLVQPGAQGIGFWSLPKAAFPLTLRLAHPSDRLRLKNGGHQKVRRVLINQKVSNHDRSQAQVLVTKTGQVLALIGYKTSVLPLLKTVKTYSLKLQKKDKRGWHDE